MCLKLLGSLAMGINPGELCVLLLHLVWARSSITEASKCYFFFFLTWFVFCLRCKFLTFDSVSPIGVETLGYFRLGIVSS